MRRSSRLKNSDDPAAAGGIVTVASRKRGRDVAEAPVQRGFFVAPPCAETLADTRRSIRGGGPRRKFRHPTAVASGGENCEAFRRSPPAPIPDVMLLDFGRAPMAARQACRRTFKVPERVEREGLLRDFTMFPPKIIKGSKRRKKYSAVPRSAELNKWSLDGEPMGLSPQVHMQLVAAMRKAGSGEVGQAFQWNHAAEKRYLGVMKLPKPPVRWIVEHPSEMGPRLSIGLFDVEQLAAWVRDLVAIKISYLRGHDVQLNFPLATYAHSLLSIFYTPEDLFLQSLTHVTIEVPALRESGFTQWRGVSLTRDSRQSAFVAYLRCSSRKVQNLGRFCDVRSAARAFDMACLRLRGQSARTNFPKEDYTMDMPYISSLSMDALVKEIKLGLSPQVSSSFLGVSQCSKTGLWRSQLEVFMRLQPETVPGQPGNTAPHHNTVVGQVPVRQDLGLWEDDIHAARAHDMAAILVQGLQAKSNFPVADYAVDFPILSKMALGELAVQLQWLSESFRTVKASQRKLDKIEAWAAAPEAGEECELHRDADRSTASWGQPVQNVLQTHKLSHLGWMPMGMPAPRPHLLAHQATGAPPSSVDDGIQSIVRTALHLKSPRLGGSRDVGKSEPLGKRTMVPHPQTGGVEPPAEDDAGGHIKICNYFKLGRCISARSQC